MKKFVKKYAKRVVGSLLFVAILIGLLEGASLLFQPKTNAKDSGIQYYMANGVFSEPKNTIDTVFIGDSCAYHSFISPYIWRDYGITSYDVATPSQKLVYSYEFLKKIFEKQSPKVVFIEMDSLFSKSYMEDEVTNRMENLFSVFRYHDRWKWLSTDDFSFSSTDYSYSMNNKGYYFTEVSESTNSTRLKKYMTASNDSESILSTNETYIHKIADFCKNKDVKLVLVAAPNARSWTCKRHNAVVSLSKELGVDFIDMNRGMENDVDINWATDTKDGGEHLNYYGAQKVTSYIGEYLNGLGIFTDKREDSEYSSWNTCLQNFDEQVASGKAGWL